VNGEVLGCHSAVIFSKFGDAALQLTRCCALEEIYRDEAQPPQGCVRFRWSLKSLPTPSHSTTTIFFPPMDPEYEPHKPAITVLAVAQ
jgi:hypothetical protein